jgi:hypothetical protein
MQRGSVMGPDMIGLARKLAPVLRAVDDADAILAPESPTHALQAWLGHRFRYLVDSSSR